MPYAGEPVTIQLADSDSDPIVLTGVGVPLPARRQTGKMWTFTSKTDGVKRVSLVDDTEKHPGMFKIAVATRSGSPRRRRTAPRPIPSSTVTIGSQCFSHSVTKKTD